MGAICALLVLLSWAGGGTHAGFRTEMLVLEPGVGCIAGALFSVQYSVGSHCQPCACALSVGSALKIASSFETSDITKGNGFNIRVCLFLFFFFVFQGQQKASYTAMQTVYTLSFLLFSFSWCK